MKKYLLLFALIISALSIQAQNGTVPELIYYKFDASGTTVQNEASSPVGTNPAPLSSVTQGGTGQFGGALQGTGSGNVATGWNLNLPGDWTMSFWIDFGAAASTFQYFLGDPGASSFRMFANGAAGVGNVTLRGPFTLDIAGVADGLPHVVHIVRDATAGTVTAYVDGIQLNSINYTGTVPTGSGFLVGAYTSSMVAGVSMDEFRMYSRALDQTEISNTWNMELPLSFAPDDAGIASIDSPSVFCPGIFDIYATIRNYGTNVITTATINWSIDGVLQSPVNFTGNLDTTGGTGSPTAQVLLGSFNFATNNPYTVSAWTSMPNGVADTVTQNDSTTAILQSNLPPPSNISASALFSTQATITWTGGSANSWLYQNLPAGSTPTGFGTATSNASATISGLTQNTSYDFYVREVCPSGDTSAWALFSYTTPCAIYIAPFFENFDAAAWSLAFPYDIDQCWNRTSTTAPFWRTEDLTTGSSNTGPATDLSGTGKYVYFETSGGSTGSTNELISPPIDISSLSAPQIEFYYHMYGATIGTLNLDVLDSAGNWVNIWTLTGQQQVSSSDPWIEVSAPFVPSTDTIQFRFQGIRGTSFSGDMAIDEVRLRDAPNDDLALTAINGLQTACGLGSNESFTVDVENKGANTQNVFDIEYSVNGGAYIIGASASSPLAFGQTQTYTIAGVDLSGSGQKCIDVRVVLTNDEDSTNNVLPQLCIFNQAVPSINSVTNGEVCNGGPITLSATYTGDNLNWYDDAALTNQVNSGTTYTANFTQTTVLYLQAINANGCTAPIQTITAEVNFTPTANFTSVTNNCTVDFTGIVSNNTDSVRWDFGDGVGTSAQLNPTYTYSSAQSFLVNLTAYDGTCFNDTVKALFVNCQVGLQSNSWAEEINIFPNPSQGLINLKIPNVKDYVKISIIEIQGKEVYKQEFAGNMEFETELNLVDLRPGTYIINISSGEKYASKKLTIK